MPDDHIRYGVGPGEPNQPDDVRVVQRLLNQNSGRIGGHLNVNGQCDAATENTILRYQRQVMRQYFASGKVTPRDETFWRLAQTLPPRLLAGALGGFVVVPVLGSMDLAEEDFQSIAKALQCEARAVKAVQVTESGHSPFDKRGRPTLLFERHLFSRYTYRKYDGRFPAISNSLPGGYSWPEYDQYVRLQQAYALAPVEALKAASWGAFQILGANFVEAGHPTVEDFVRSMCSSVQEQCDAFVAFMLADAGRLKGIREKNWALLAAHYNGPNYKAQHYDESLARNYADSIE